MPIPNPHYERDWQAFATFDARISAVVVCNFD